MVVGVDEQGARARSSLFVLRLLGRVAGQMKLADARLYQGYRSDLVLDVRQMQVALRKLRVFAREGAKVVVNDVGAARDGSGTDGLPADAVAREIVAEGEL